MANKRYDLAVKTGTYQNQNGETKNRYKNVGSLLENEDGGKFILIDPCFNFAGIRREDNRDMVIVSIFEPKVKEQPKQINDPSEIEFKE